MVVASHNYARTINGRARFLPETIKLIEHAGHKWSRGTWHQKKRAGEEEALPQYNRQTVMLSARVIDSSEADALTALQFCNQLSRDQKEALERYFYCKAWGISNHALDAAWFEHHSAADSSAAPLRVLEAALQTCRPLYTCPPVPLAADRGEMILPVQARAKVIAELLQVLGVTNVLGTTQPITLTAEKLDALRTCQAFRAAEHSRNTARVFGIDSSANGEFRTAGSITKRLAALFIIIIIMLPNQAIASTPSAPRPSGAEGTLFKAGAGITLVTSSQRYQQAGARTRVYTVGFEGGSVSRMAQLLKINHWRHRHFTSAYDGLHSEVADPLQQLQLGEQYSKYAASPCILEDADF
jgi:hypothetical protein